MLLVIVVINLKMNHMKIKKEVSSYTQKKFNEKLEKSSKLFTLLGLVLSLFVVHVFIEYETKQIKISIAQPDNLNPSEEYAASLLFKKEIIPVKQEIKEAPKKVHKEIIEVFDEIVPVDNDKELPDELRVVENKNPELNIDSLAVEEELELIVEDVPLLFVEDAPVFPGCVGTAVQLKKCLSKNVKKHVNRKFNNSLSQELNLSSGKKKIFVMFKIDKAGMVSDIQIRAPHPSLKKEAERVVKLLPKMKPGMQGGRAVGVRYSLPISFEVP